MKIFLAITIDTECDKGEKWRVKQPLSFLNTRVGIAENLQPIFDKHGVRVTYLISPEVMMDEESVSFLKSVEDRTELGTHLHSEFIGPHENLLSDYTEHYQSDFSSDIERKKLANLTQLFIRTFGYRPRSFRAGRFGISGDTLSHLQELGYLIDSSVTPDLMWRNHAGNSANFFGTPYQPYFPSSDNFRKPGELKILEVPVSTINPKLVKLPLWAKRRINLKTRYHHILYNLYLQGAKTLWLRPTYSDVNAMNHVTEMFAKNAQNEMLFLCMMFHSNEFSIDTSPYSLTPERLVNLQERLDDYLSLLKENYTVSFVRLTEIRKYFIDSGF